MIQFRFLFKAPRGHKFFRDDYSGRVAVVDDSGADPYTADHAMLWVDHERRIMKDPNLGFQIPVVDDAGVKYRTPCDFTEAAWAAENLDLKIEDAFGVYVVQKVSNAPSVEITAHRLTKSNSWGT